MTDDPPRVVRRRRGPFKRSRTGCGTCKRRGKKCDEIWSPEGFCQRCLAGPWECTGRTEGPMPPSSSGKGSAPVSAGHAQALGLNVAGVGGLSAAPDAVPSGPSRSRGSGSGPSAGTGGSSVVGAGMPPPPPSSMASAQAGPSSGPALSPSVVMSSRSDSVGSGMTTSPPMAPPPIHSGTINVNSVMNNVSAVMASAAALAPGATVDGINHVAGLWNGYLNAGGGRPSPSSSPSSVAAGFKQQPLFDWPSAGGGAGMPSAVLTTCADGSLAIDTPQSSASGGPVVDGSSLQDFWNDLSASFNGPTPTAMGSFSFNPSSRVLFLNSDKPMRQGVSLAEIYARVVESWLVGLPGPTRDYARARILALHDSNSVIRGVRYAVAAAYIFLFASDPHAEPEGIDTHPSPKPKLVELACRGAGIVEGSVRGPSDSDGKRDAVKKLRFYVDHVSTPFAGDLESTKWTEDAVQELRNVIVTDRRQLSDLLWGVIDLQLVEFIRGGAAPSYNMLALGDRLVRSVFGCERPPITLSDLRTSETFSLRLYGLSDVSRCIVQRGRRTIFNFNSDDSAATLPLTKEDETWSTYLGLPDAIVILLAEIVNLCADQTTASFPPAVVKERADKLEAALRSWTPTPPVGIDASALISRTIAGEMWRLCALVLLYQSVHRVGSLHPVLRRAGTELLSLLASASQLPNGDLWGFIALPSFLAATLAFTDQDRQRAMTFLVRAGPERVWLDNIALVEKLWEETDKTGRAVDWHDKMVREGLSVAFF